MRPLIVLEPGVDSRSAIAEVQALGWTVVPGWTVPRGQERVVCFGSVATDEDAAAALLAALCGAGVIVESRAGRDVIDRLCDDLRHVGTLSHRTSSPAGSHLSHDEQALIQLLRDGLTLGAAAQALHLSRRTADRRMASIRRMLGARSTAEAVVRAGRPLDASGPKLAD